MKRRSAARSSVSWPRARESGDRQLWILAGCDHQVHLWRQVSEQKGEGLVHRGRVDNVVVVQDEDEGLRDGGDLVEQSCQERIRRRWLGGLERSQCPCANTRGDRLQRCYEVRQEAGRVAIPFVKRQPGPENRRFSAIASREPFADQGGLAKTGGRGDQDQLTL